jgi:CHAD domain-containing protein
MPRLDPTESVVSNSSRVLPRLVHRYFDRGRRLVKEKPSDRRLHRFRIRTKRIRYTLELYLDLIPAIADSLPDFQQIQQALGDLQDQYMFRAWLERHAPGGSEHKPQQALLDAVEKKQRALRKAFFREWKKLEKSDSEKSLLHAIKQASEA